MMRNKSVIFWRCFAARRRVEGGDFQRGNDTEELSRCDTPLDAYVLFFASRFADQKEHQKVSREPTY